MWFTQVPRPLDWHGTHGFVNEVDLALSADEVFAIFADIDQWPLWFTDIRKGTWTSPAPLGVGSERTVVLKTLSVKEAFLAWDPGKRYTFTMKESTLPLTWSIIEDYRLEPTATGCKLTWDVTFDLRWWARPLSPVVNALFGKMFRDAAASLKAYVAEKARVAKAG